MENLYFSIKLALTGENDDFRNKAKCSYLLNNNLTINYLKICQRVNTNNDPMARIVDYCTHYI